MIEWLISVYERCRDLAAKANDAKDRLLVGEDDAAKTINGYMKQDYDALIRLWKEVDPEMKNTGRLSDMARHVRFGMNNDYEDIVVHDIPPSSMPLKRWRGTAPRMQEPWGSKACCIRPLLPAL